MFSLLISAFIACTIMVVIAWIIQFRIRNAGIVDAFWSWNFPICAAIAFFSVTVTGPAQKLLLFMVCVWGLRLGFYLFFRTLGHIKVEDIRYAAIRKEKGGSADQYFLFFFLAQAVSNVILSIPFFIVMLNPDKEIQMLEWIAFIIWAIGVVGESIADLQLSSFKKDPANKGKVCEKGLWYYSRHPNYFFESLVWIGYAVYALDAPYGWVALFAPAIIILLLLKVTGVPMTEDLAVRSKGEAYKKYQRSTSVLIPWFKKK